jgi:glycosyltransferase involved in cell wall biosynthesis
MNIVMFSTADADHLIQRPHQLACAFSRLGCGVAFVNPVTNVVSSPLRRIVRRVRGHASVFPCRNVDIVDVYQIQVPLWRKPLFGYHARPESLRAFLRRRLAGATHSPRAAILSHPVMLEYVPVELFSVIAYDFFDDDSVFGGSGHQKYRDMQQQLIGASQVLITTSPVLSRTLRDRIPHDRPVLEVPNGVNLQWFQDRARHTGNQRSASGRRTVGYVGAVYDWIDCELVLRVASLCPGVDFELVGPVSPAHRRRMSVAPPNVHLVGEVPYEDVPGHVAVFDVCMIPFVRGTIADSTDPIKLYEYFSLGKPVVATPMKQLEQYREMKLLRIAEDPGMFAAAIDELLQKDSRDLREKRVAVAAQHSWMAHAEKILDALRNAASTASPPATSGPRGPM